MEAGAAELPMTAQDLPFVRFAVAQATRRGEALGLRWRDLDLDARLMTLHGQHGRGTKNQESRKERGPEVRPLMPEALEILRAMMPESGEPDPAAKVFSVGGATAFSVRFGRMVAKANLHDLTFHDLRHEATSRLALRYPNPLDLKRVTGHKDLKSLDRYYNPDLSELAVKGQVLTAQFSQ
jgi:integrase